MTETRKLGIALVVLGVLLLAGAAFAYTYAQSHTLIRDSTPIYLPPTYPYREDAFGLVLGSVALFVVGFTLMVYRTKNS